MSNPKEKAKELYCKYTDALNIRDLQATANPFAKQCALIAVNEILDFMMVDDKESKTCYWANHPTLDYWYNVKQEIEKL